MQTESPFAIECATLLIAFYLPQFHPIPENNEWWGQGFTEWTNVASAKPLFRGHYQPHIPSDLGFYDLRLPEIRDAQASLAREYGIGGFCYYHYWFSGKRLLERPFNEVLHSKKPDFPFCLCWANENWTRRWDGHERKILMPQTYSEEDDQRHIDWLIEAFSDNRYIRINKKLLFLIYRTAKLPNPKRTTDLWRERVAKAGLGELLLCMVENNFGDPPTDPADIGFDAAIQFQPRLALLHRRSFRHRLYRRVLRELGLERNGRFEYSQLMGRAISMPIANFSSIPCVIPGWDNTARLKQKALVINGSTPELYREWLKHAIQIAPILGGERVIFINAWNEWAEGCHLEPCQKWGRSFLEATREALSQAAGALELKPPRRES